jgi:hypothetical protein
MFSVQEIMGIKPILQQEPEKILILGRQQDFQIQSMVFGAGSDGDRIS